MRRQDSQHLHQPLAPLPVEGAVARRKRNRLERDLLDPSIAHPGRGQRSPDVETAEADERCPAATRLEAQGGLASVAGVENDGRRRRWRAQRPRPHGAHRRTAAV